MSDTKRKMLQWLNDDGTAMGTPGTLVVAETTGETFDAHSSDAAKHLTAEEKAALLNAKPVQIVDDVAARDAIADPFVGLSCYVKDATGDSTVAAGGAFYLYDGAGWIKTAESESMDVVFPLTGEQMLDLEAKKHTHPNAESLNRLSVIGGSLGIDGVAVGGGSIAIVTSPDATPVYDGKLRVLVTEYTPPAV